MIVLPLLDNDHPIKNYDGLGKRFLNALLAIGLILLGSYLNWNTVLLIIIVLPSSFLFSKLTRTLMPDWAKSQRKESVKISSTQIDFCNNTRPSVQLENVEFIEILANRYRGFQSNHLDIVHNGVAQFTLKFKGEVASSTFKVLVRNKVQFDQLCEVISIWYGQGAKIQETFTTRRLNSFCLKHDLSYEEIAEKKETIGLAKPDRG